MGGGGGGEGLNIEKKRKLKKVSSKFLQLICLRINEERRKGLYEEMGRRK